MRVNELIEGKSRAELMDVVDEIYLKESDMGTVQGTRRIEEVLKSHGASIDDSDPREGFYVTMTDQQIREAYKEIVNGYKGESFSPDMSRKSLMDMADDLFSQAWLRYGLDDEAHEIIDKNNASKDDSDPNEGYFITMSNEDIVNMINDLESLLKSKGVKIESKSRKRVKESTVSDVIVDTDELINEVKSIVKQYNHMELDTPINLIVDENARGRTLTIREVKRVNEALDADGFDMLMDEIHKHNISIEDLEHAIEVIKDGERKADEVAIKELNESSNDNYPYKVIIDWGFKEDHEAYPNREDAEARVDQINDLIRNNSFLSGLEARMETDISGLYHPEELAKRIDPNSKLEAALDHEGGYQNYSTSLSRDEFLDRIKSLGFWETPIGEYADNDDIYVTQYGIEEDGSPSFIIYRYDYDGTYEYDEYDRSFNEGLQLKEAIKSSDIKRLIKDASNVQTDADLADVLRRLGQLDYLIYSKYKDRYAAGDSNPAELGQMIADEVSKVFALSKVSVSKPERIPTYRSYAAIPSHPGPEVRIKESVNESRKKIEEDTSSLSREELMDEIYRIQMHASGFNLEDKFEEVLTNHNANPDDSDPEEGYFNTMSDEDIKLAYEEISKIYIKRVLDEYDFDTIANDIEVNGEALGDLLHYPGMPDDLKEWSLSLSKTLMGIAKDLRDRNFSNKGR